MKKSLFLSIKLFIIFTFILAIINTGLRCPCDDIDKDKVCDSVDNCICFNPDQKDTNLDGIGDLCDPDSFGNPEQCPILVEKFPFYDSKDTNNSNQRIFDYYNCAPTTNESGPEFVYMFEVKERGTLIAMVNSKNGSDIDLHILNTLNPDACLNRGHIGTSYNLEPGWYYLIADTWVNSDGVQLSGLYDLTLRFIEESNKCAMEGEPIMRYGETTPLNMPATGYVVKEAHLVTTEEFPNSWPTGYWDGIPEHYILSEEVSGFKADRTQPWAPCCEGGNHYGQGCCSKPTPIEEAWYINMRYAKNPPAGQRYIIYDGFTGKAVVAAAGYENGPGDLKKIGGATEEIFIYLGKKSIDTMTFGVAKNQNLQFGPIDCE